MAEFDSVCGKVAGERIVYRVTVYVNSKFEWEGDRV